MTGEMSWILAGLADVVYFLVYFRAVHRREIITDLVRVKVAVKPLTPKERRAVRIAVERGVAVQDPRLAEAAAVKGRHVANLHELMQASWLRYGNVVSPIDLLALWAIPLIPVTPNRAMWGGVIILLMCARGPHDKNVARRARSAEQANRDVRSPGPGEAP
jgi:hypothetical protein